MRADPLSLDVRRVTALIQVEAGLYDQAIANARWVLQRDPEFPYAELWLARALLLSGRAKEAAPLLANKHWSYRAYLYAVTGRRDEAEAMVAAHPADAAAQMYVYGGLNDADRAFAALERAFELHWWRAATWMQRPEVAILQRRSPCGGAQEADGPGRSGRLRSPVHAHTDPRDARRDDAERAQE